MNAYYRVPSALWIVISIALMLAIATTYDALGEMVYRWDTSEEYGYGYMIPVLTLFLIWQRKDKLEMMPFTGAWLGVLLMAAGVLLALVGQLSAIVTISQYGFVIAVIGAVYAVMGWSAFKVVIAPLLLLFLMVPLPNFVFNNLSAELQLISSQIGVFVIRLFDISVHLDGNVIDLGTYKLQVVEACSGLRYLFPLVALSIIASYFYQAAIWKRIVVVLSSMPITVFMNSFRIGVIGVLVDAYGIEQAEGFLHDFEGWIVFMACVALLILEIWLLSLIGKDNRPFREIFGMEFPVATPEGVSAIKRVVPRHAYVGLILLGLGTLAAVAVGGRVEHIPDREEFTNFPMSIGDWAGRKNSLDDIIVDALKLDDYIITDYRSKDNLAVNYYVAYYGSQSTGASAHSPRTCLPGGGWLIESHTIVDLGDGLRANRFIIRMGDSRQLVYYWFKQRDRIITNEFAVKWYMLVDALLRNRTDGALIRLTTVIPDGENVDNIERHLQDFARAVSAPLVKYVPD